MALFSIFVVIYIEAELANQMENFIVSARKYRPTTFDSVVGQESITSTLKNAIKTNHLSQSYLFCGPRGVGKTTCARILAKTINCQNITDNVEACDECESCKSFNSSRSFSIHELDAASNNKVDDIRTLTDQVRIPPQVGNYSIYIIDEVHMLSTSAFNAFLKTLEEPPPHAIFILATTEKQKIIPTILSRCQIFDFHRITIDDIADRLSYVAEKEGIETEREGLHIIAQKADGAMRDALSIFDQIVSFSGDRITYANVIENLNVLDYEYYLKITDAFLAADISSALLLFNEILDKGFDGHNFISGLASHIRSLLVCKDEVTVKLLEVGSSIKIKYSEQTQKCSSLFLYKSLDILGSSDINYKIARNKRLHVELTLIRLCNLNMKPEDEKKKIEQDKPLESENEHSPAKEVKAEKDNVLPAKDGDEKVIIQARPVSNGSAKSFSIKQKMQVASEKEKTIEREKDDEVAENGRTYENRAINSDNLVSAWQKFGESLEGTTARLKSILKAMEPQLTGESEINLFLATEAQKEYIDTKYKQQISDFLIKELQNSDLVFNTIVVDKSKDVTPYTLDDKYRHMREKNPDIDKLRKDFLLDYD